MLAVHLVAESFHRTWSLWWQLPVLVVVLGLTARPLLEVARGVAWSRLAVVIAVAAPIAVAVLLPQREYHFAGHEGAYGELLDGDMPETGDLSGHRTFAAPAGLAWAAGRIMPGGAARFGWLVWNRASLAVVLLLLAGSAAWLAGEGTSAQRRATLLAVLGGLAVPALLGRLGVRTVPCFSGQMKRGGVSNWTLGTPAEG